MNEKNEILEAIKKYNQEIEKFELEIEKSQNKIIKLKEKYRNNLNKTRRERARHLILVGALLEMAGIDEEDPATLLGYFLQFKNLNEIELDSCQFKGLEMMRERNEEKEQKRLERRVEKMKKKKEKM